MKTAQGCDAWRIQCEPTPIQSGPIVGIQCSEVGGEKGDSAVNGFVIQNGRGPTVERGLLTLPVCRVTTEESECFVKARGARFAKLPALKLNQTDHCPPKLSDLRSF